MLWAIKITKGCSSWRRSLGRGDLEEFGRLLKKKTEKPMLSRLWIRPKSSPRKVLTLSWTRRIYSANSIINSLSIWPVPSKTDKTFISWSITLMVGISGTTSIAIITLTKNKSVHHLHYIEFVIRCIMEGLRYLHENNIIHRDIKPENIILDQKGYCRITDMGVARYWKMENSH